MDKLRSVKARIMGIIFSVVVSACFILGNGKTAFAEESDPVCRIGETTYESLDDAISNALNRETITMIADSDETSDSLRVVSEITIDLNGHTVTSTGIIQLVSNLEIKDSSVTNDKEGTGKIIITPVDALSYCGVFVEPNCKFTLTSGTLQIEKVAGICTSGGKVLIDKRAKLICNDNRGIYNVSTNKADLEVSGTIISDGIGIYFEYPGDIRTKSGTVISKSDIAICIEGRDASAEVSSGALKGTTGLWVDDGALSTVNNTEIFGSDYGIVCESNGFVNVSSGIITGEKYQSVKNIEGAFNISGGLFSDNAGNSSDFRRHDDKRLSMGVNDEYPYYYGLMDYDKIVISMEYIPVEEAEPITLKRIEPSEYYSWRPSISQKDVIKVTENGVETTYICDNDTYRDTEGVRGFYDNEGHALADRFRCFESTAGGKLSEFRPHFEWIDGAPTKSGVYASYRFVLYDKYYPESVPPVAVSDPIEVFVTPEAVIDDIKYTIAEDGTAKVTGFESGRYDDIDEDWDDEDDEIKTKEYVIKDKVVLDDGKEYTVAHIGSADVYSSAFDDSGCFGDCEDMGSVYIPDTITSIKSYAFFNTPNLKEVTIPDTVVEIGKYAFGYTGEFNFFGDGYTDLEKIPGFVIYAKKGSAAYKYAKINGFKCIDKEAEAKEAEADEAYNKAKAEAEAKAKAEAEEKAKKEAAENTPAKGKITKLIKGKKKFKVKWKKDAKATGYTIRYSTDKNFKKGIKTKNVNKYTKKGIFIKNLKKKTWYVQVRAYRKVNGKTYYGDWSAAKKVKVK